MRMSEKNVLCGLFHIPKDFSSLNSTTQANITAGSHGSYIHHVVAAGLDKCFDGCNYHDSLKAHLIEGIGHCYITGVKFKCTLIG